MKESDLISFTRDERTRLALKEYLDDYISQYALDRIYKREDISGIADAKKIIDDAMENLITLYGIQEAKNPTITKSR